MNGHGLTGPGLTGLGLTGLGLAGLVARRCVAAGLVALLLVSAGCADSRTSVCPDGLRCPLGRQCAAMQNTCIEIDGCGDGKRDPDEACDDGNVRSGDGCSADCTSVERCHDGLVDPGEQCGEPSLQDLQCVHLGYDFGHLGCTDCVYDESECNGFEWTRWSSGSQQPLRAIWGRAPDDIFAVGDQRAILHHDGQTWSSSGGVEDVESLTAIWGMGPDRALAVGDNGRLWRHVAASDWVVVFTLQDTPLRGIWGTGPDDIFVVGDTGVVSLHFDAAASRWSEIARTTTAQPLTGIWGNAALAQVFAVGVGGVILRHDGATWQTMVSPVDADLALNAVWGTDTGEVFAVGDAGTMVRYDGADWASMDPITPHDLRAVWGTGATDVYAVGDSGTILHFDGTLWSSRRSTTERALYGVWGDGLGQVTAIGDAGTLLRYGTDDWTPMPTPDGTPLHDIWGAGLDEVFAVGQGGTILRHDGAVWQTVATTPMTVTDAWLHSVWGRGSGERFAVGDGGTILSYQPLDQTFVLEPSPSTARLRDVSGLEAGAVYAVGDDSTLLRRMDTGTGWELIAAPEDYGDFVDVSVDQTGVGACAYMAGDRGLIRWCPDDDDNNNNGEPGWQVLSNDGPLTGVWSHGAAPMGTGPVFAVGVGGRVGHYDGTTWTRASVAPTVYGLSAIAGQRRESLYAVGARDTVLHCRELDCAPILPPAGVSEFRSVWVADDDTVFLLSGTNTVYRMRLPATL